MTSPSKAGSSRFGVGTKLLLALSAAGMLLVGLELALRVAYFQKKGATPTALQAAVDHLRLQKNHRQAMQAIEDWNLPDIEVLEAALFQPEGALILEELKGEYESVFLELMEAVKAKDSRFLVLYVPSWSSPEAEEGSRSFYSALCEKHSVDFLDLSPPLHALGQAAATLNPVDFHLSRHGHLVIAEALLEELPKYLGEHRSSVDPTAGVKIFGDMPASRSKVDLNLENIPHRVLSNAGGLRMNGEIDAEKTNQRILFLGDSFTYGMYVHNHEIYVSHLAGTDQSKEYINAGIPGYTITQERDLYLERAQHLASDLVVLQVLDNDLVGLLSFLKVTFARAGEDISGYVPTEVEKQFLKFASGLKTEDKS